MTIYAQEKTTNRISSSKAYRFKIFNKPYSFGFFSKMNWLSRRRRSGKKLFSLLTCCSSSSSSDINTYEKNRNSDSRQDSSNRLSNNNTAAPSQTLTYSTTSEISKEKEKVTNDIESYIINNHPISNNNNNDNNNDNNNINNNNEHINDDPETNSITTSISKKSNSIHQHPIEQSESINDLHETTTPSLESEQDLWLLGPVSESLKGRKCLVLDMDETLLHSSFKVAPGADFIVPVEIDGTHHDVFVLKRPGVDAFMKRMGELYEIVVFTASLSKYADPVLNTLDLHNVVRHRLFRESCFHYKGTYVKDLSQLGRELNQVIILDNSPASYIFHTSNAIPVSSWFNDPHDSELMDLIPFLEDLATVDDVTDILDSTIPGPFSHL